MLGNQNRAGEHFNDGPGLNVAQWVLFGAATVAVALRLGARFDRKFGIWWDDVFMILSLFIFLSACVLTSISIHYGLGKSSVNVDSKSLPDATKYAIISVNLGMIADVVPKLAIAFLINRLLIQKFWFKCVTVCASILLIIMTLILVIISFVQCSPVSYGWNRNSMAGHCWDIKYYTHISYGMGAYSAFVDVFFTFLPVVIIARLHMHWRKKATVMVTMGFGVVTCGVTIYKVAAQYPQFTHAPTDATRVLANVLLWNAIESSFAIIAGSIPTWGWLLRTQPVKHFFTTITFGKIHIHGRTGSAQMEKAPFAYAKDSLNHGSDVSQASLRDGRMLSFPSSVHTSDNLRMNAQLDSLQRLERSAYV